MHEAVLHEHMLQLPMPEAVLAQRLCMDAAPYGLLYEPVRLLMARRVKAVHLAATAVCLLGGQKLA
jgi:hypothetical protein